MKKMFLLICVLLSEASSMNAQDILESLNNKEKNINMAIHLAKRQHIKTKTEIEAQKKLPLCIPINCNSDLLVFIRDFYSLFDESVKRTGVISKLSKNSSEIKLIQSGLTTVGKVLESEYSNSLNNEQIQNCLRQIKKLQDIIKVYNIVPTKDTDLPHVHRRIEGIQEQNYKDQLNTIATKENVPALVAFKELRASYLTNITADTCAFLVAIRSIKEALDQQLRMTVLEQIVPSILSAANLFVKNVATDDKEISSEEIVISQEIATNKLQLVCTRQYAQLEYKKYMKELQVEGSVNCAATIKAVLSKEDEVKYLSTFYVKDSTP